jgi:hypothetical protein
MHTKKANVVLKWSKRERDWVANFHNSETSNGRPVVNSFLGMVTDFERLMRQDCFGKPTGFTNLRDYLEGAGFDPDTFTISVKSKDTIRP